MKTIGGTTFGMLIALVLLPKCKAIRCYYCTTANNSACNDLTIYEPEVLADMKMLVNCENAIPGGISVEFFCRKIVQTILRPGHDSELRVTRGCGWVKHHRDCYKADNADHLETVCQCFGDACNSSPRPSAFSILTLSLTASIALARLFCNV